MRSRWLSTFNLLGILLVILGVVGLVIGHKFTYDPGQIPEGNEPWCYVAAGVLMLMNGFFAPAREDVPAPPGSMLRQAVTTPASERPID